MYFQYRETDVTLPYFALYSDDTAHLSSIYCFLRMQVRGGRKPPQDV